jgi:hypothetical protein
MVAGWPAHVAITPPLCLKGVLVELKREIMEGKGGKEGEGGPPLNPYFHPPLHLAPIMLTLLTKSIKSKANCFHPFSKFFFILFFENFRFYIIQ